MKLSICMITYNHTDYLKQAIDGVLMQKTNFDYELVIANDNSPDNSDEIIQDYIKTHPEGHKIKYLHNTLNIGMMPNFVKALTNCSGEYIALCEGDDYWTDANKLQKQVDFLDNNLDYSICFHHASIDTKGVITEDAITLKSNQTTTIEDLAKGNYIHTCSVVFRNKLFNQFPSYFAKAPVGDYFLHMLNARFGKIYCIEEIMANYRVHETSYWSSKQQEERTAIWIDFLENMKENFTAEIQILLTNQIEAVKRSAIVVIKKPSITKKIKNRIRKFFNIEKKIK